MRFERLVIEAEDNHFSLDFHPQLTVISGVERMEREGLLNELLGSLGSTRAGVHAEIAADNGNRFAIFRPHGARARVIDIEAAVDVSGRFADADGRIDLLAVAGLDARTARRSLCLTATDLTTSTHHDQVIRRLASLDSTQLWSTALRADEAQRHLDEVTNENGTSAEDAAVVARIEERHVSFEAEQQRAAKYRYISFVAGAVAALCAIPTAIFVGRVSAMFWILVAAGATGLSFWQNKRMEEAQEEEAEALAAVGADSYLGFHLKRVNGMLDSETIRQRVIDANTEHEAAMADWFALVGDIMPDWAQQHRLEIDDTARRLDNAQELASGPLPVDTEGGDQIGELAHSLMMRLELVNNIGPAGESLPLVLDDSLSGLDAEMKAPLLEMLVRSSKHQQIVFLTEDEDVSEWARVEAMTGELSILEPAHAEAEQANTEHVA